MIKVLICCGGGFSSSYMAKALQDDIISKGYQEKMTVDFSPFLESYQVKDNYDVVMCCPHLTLKVSEYLEKYGKNVPYYIFPSMMYGRMYVKDIYRDALDIIEGFKQTQMNPFFFPGEDGYFVSKRVHCYRHYHPDYTPEQLKKDPDH